MITQELLEWGSKHTKSKVRQLAMHLINLSQSVKADAERMRNLSEALRNMSVQLWVSARLNQELAQLLGIQYTSADEVHKAIENVLNKVLQEAREKSVPENVIEEMRKHFTQSVRVNDEPLYEEVQ